jgi:hypothetical protein
MTRLGEADDDALLEGGQQAEERIGSVDYDVWKCGGCGHHFTLRYAKWVSGYAQCPQCHNRTKSSTENVIAPASTISSGSARVVETCEFCTFRRARRFFLVQSGSVERLVVKRLSSGGSSSLRRRSGWWRRPAGLPGRQAPAIVAPGQRTVQGIVSEGQHPPVGTRSLTGSRRSTRSDAFRLIERVHDLLGVLQPVSALKTALFTLANAAGVPVVSAIPHGVVAAA